MSHHLDYEGIRPDGVLPAFSPTSQAPEVAPQGGIPKASPRADTGGFVDRSTYGGQTAEYPSGWPHDERLGSSEGRDTMSSPGLESVRYMESEKETYQPGSRSNIDGNNDLQAQKRRRMCGMPLWLLLTVLGVFTVLAVGLGVGLGVGLNQQKRCV